MFWAAPHCLHGKAAELVARHGAVVVRGMTANEFFPGLMARAEALGQRAEPAPTRELSVARLKRALPDPVRRIDLHELVDAEALRVVARLSDGDRYPPGERTRTRRPTGSCRSGTGATATPCCTCWPWARGATRAGRTRGCGCGPCNGR
ncbi:hypothetical protein [Streptomyces glaucescens]|uniref:hypothetical protein n=1 Tax=Streptomyces glaucescens TaxID=1907 RepID=UPI001B803569|nr:hypothetical protein [Streptomyces glaucescens]